MELNRNQFFLIGVVLVLLGLQMRRVESFTLTEEASRFIAQRLHRGGLSEPSNTAFSTPAATPARVVRPPKWLGFALLSLGGVLVLHSLAMPRPG